MLFFITAYLRTSIRQASPGCLQSPPGLPRMGAQTAHRGCSRLEKEDLGPGLAHEVGNLLLRVLRHQSQHLIEPPGWAPKEVKNLHTHSTAHTQRTHAQRDRHRKRNPQRAGLFTIQLYAVVAGAPTTVTPNCILASAWVCLGGAETASSPPPTVKVLLSTAGF